MRALRIAVVAACPFPSLQGTQVYLRGLCRSLIEAGHQVHLVVYGHGDLTIQALRGLSIHRTRRFPGYRSLRSGPHPQKLALDFLLARKLLNVVSDEAIDVIHAHNYEAPLVAYWVRKKTGCPVVYTAHNLMEDELWTYTDASLARAPARRLGRALDASVPQKADFCTTLSQEGALALRGLGVSSDRLAVLPPGVEPSDFARPDSSAAPERAFCDYRGAPRVIYAGNPDAYQDLPILFQAFARIQGIERAARLALLSSSPLEGLASLAASYGVDPQRLECHVTSSWAEVRRFLQEARVAVSPRQRCVGYPMKVLNYRALGLPVVACRGSSHGLEDGVTGRVVENGDVDGFAEAMLSCIQSPEKAQAMGLLSRDQVFEKQSWSGLLPLWEQVYARTIGLAKSDTALKGVVLGGG